MCMSMSMKRIRMGLCLGMTLVGVTTGCNSTSGNRYAEGPGKPRGVNLVYSDSATACRSCRTYQNPLTAKPMQAAPAYVTPASHEEPADVGQEVVTADHVMVEGEPPMIVPAGGVQPEMVPAAGTEIIQTAGTEVVQVAAPGTVQQPAGSQWAPVVEHVVPARGTHLQGETIPARRSVTDITASPCFSKAEDYSWLQGRVEYSRMNKSWRIRYASVDEVDRFGGSVTLTGDTLLDTLKDGEYVRVRGYLPNPDTRAIAPPYRVEAIEPVQQQ
jgi:hypothetical protein